MARSWIVNGVGIARKVTGATLPYAHQIKDCGANRECPNCHYLIDNNDVLHEWPGLPLGVKFDPSDIELLEHLEAKCGVKNMKPHLYIDEFIPTLDVEGGVCYRHPEDLPGAKKDGSCVYFFHRTSNAYNTGQRKRRKVQRDSSVTEQVRWHKTGKTKALLQDGTQKGCKKIMVLYVSSVNGSKPSKANWVMHQYHLGCDEDEKEDQYVVSKIFYQAAKESNVAMNRVSPLTPKTVTPDPSPREKSFSCDDIFLCQSHAQDNMDNPSLLAGESQDVGLDGIEERMFCDEMLDLSSPFSVPEICNVSGADRVSRCGYTDLGNLDMGTPPDFQSNELDFPSQDSSFGWMDRL